VFLRGTGVQTSPIVDLPPGLAGILPTSMFEAATSDAQTKMLEALLAVDHPLKVAPDTAPCVACHTSTPVLDARAPAGVDVWGIRGAYVSSHNITVETRASPGGAGRVRAFGYIGRTPVISRRVAHETAQVLSEIEQRFP
jgi:mono/diheme cytochrome c family protein